MLCDVFIRHEFITYFIYYQVVPAPCEDQLLLVDLVGAIKVLPTDTLIQTVKDVLNNPPSSELSRTKVWSITCRFNALL